MATDEETPFEMLDRLIAESGLRVTFDAGRNHTHPCTFCGTKDRPRVLVNLGVYHDGRDTISRPVCETGPCMDVARLRATKQDQGGERT